MTDAFLTVARALDEDPARLHGSGAPVVFAGRLERPGHAGSWPVEVHVKAVRVRSDHGLPMCGKALDCGMSCSQPAGHLAVGIPCLCESETDGVPGSCPA